LHRDRLGPGSRALRGRQGSHRRRDRRPAVCDRRVAATAIEDYLLTNDAGDFEQFLRTRHDTQLGLTDIHHPLLSMPDDIRRVLFSADAEFLQAAFESIDALGGLDSYLEKTVAVSREQRAAVEATLTA
jgi:protein tyrosine/serine phosphatase